MQARSANKTDRSLKLALSLVLLTAALIIQSVPRVFAATLLLNRTDKISDSTVSSVANHEVSFTITDFAAPVGSIVIEFCANDPFPGTACVVPNGFTASGTTLVTQTGETGFSIHPSSTATKIILSRPPALVTISDVLYEFDSVTNPSDKGTYYVRLQTFSSDDGTGTSIQEGGIALSINDEFNVSTEVLPFLRFCAAVTIIDFDCGTATNFFIDLGEFSVSQTRRAQSELVAVTNAPSGLSISISGTTLTSGNNIITPLGVAAASSTGTSQFGINLRDNSNPDIGGDPVGPGVASVRPGYNVTNAFSFNSGDVVAGSVGTNDYRKFTVSYIANINDGQAPGVYATTISFIALANF